MPNHFITADMDKMPPEVQEYRDQLEGRCMLVRSLNILPVEAIVRGYITGSGWKEYCTKGTVCDIPLEAGLTECAALPRPLFTPSTKAEYGEHDENIHPSQVARMIGDTMAQEVETKALEIYSRAATWAKERGIILADTKMEFGTDAHGTLFLVDEVLTPDSSRFWPARDYQAGRAQDSFDKQYVRDYLESISFDKKTPIELPQDVVDKTAAKYREVYELLTGKSL